MKLVRHSEGGWWANEDFLTEELNLWCQITASHARKLYSFTLPCSCGLGRGHSSDADCGWEGVEKRALLGSHPEEVTLPLPLTPMNRFIFFSREAEQFGFVVEFFFLNVGR